MLIEGTGKNSREKERPDVKRIGLYTYKPLPRRMG